MALGEILLGFAISYFASNTPAIKELITNKKKLAAKIEECYKSAVKKRYGIDQWHLDMIPFRFRSLQSFGNHLASSDNYEEETMIILGLFEQEIKNDHECCQFIIDMKIDSIADNIEEVKRTVKAKSKSFSEISTALKSVNCRGKRMSS